MKNTVFFVIAAILASACAGSPGIPGSAPSAAFGGDDRLDTEEFAGLPPEAKAYLQDLSRAFRGQDKNFLLSQGESRFEAEVKSQYDDESYLALLYRTGPYGSDAPWAEPSRPRLAPEEVTYIEYSGWEERGPVLEIRGRLITPAEAVPCVIMLVWRLADPKIQGLYP
jgi:hypothetical protein